MTPENEKRLAEIRACAERWAEQDDESAEAVRSLFVMLDAETRRAEDAERKLAALRVAAARYVLDPRTLREEADRIERGET